MGRWCLYRLYEFPVLYNTARSTHATGVRTIWKWSSQGGDSVAYESISPAEVRLPRQGCIHHEIRNLGSSSCEWTNWTTLASLETKWRVHGHDYPTRYVHYQKVTRSITTLDWHRSRQTYHDMVRSKAAKHSQRTGSGLPLSNRGYASSMNRTEFTQVIIISGSSSLCPCYSLVWIFNSPLCLCYILPGLAWPRDSEGTFNGLVTEHSQVVVVVVVVVDPLTANRIIEYSAPLTTKTFSHIWDKCQDHADIQINSRILNGLFNHGGLILPPIRSKLFCVGPHPRSTVRWS